MPFRKGCSTWNKGKTYEELYGDRADEVRAKASGKLVGRKGNKDWWNDLPEKEKIRQSKIRGENALFRNAQKGKPHRNPEAVSRGVLKYWDKFGRGNWKGPNNPNWKGGPKESPYASDEWRKIAGLVRKRDLNTCQDCWQVGDEVKNRIEVHHIDGNAWNHDFGNLVTLCQSCHNCYRGVQRAS